MFSVDSAGIHVFALTIFWSAICSVLGMWLAAEIAARLAVRGKHNPLHVWRAMLWVVVFAIIGARLWFVLFPPLSYTENGVTAVWLLSHPFELNMGAISIWAGGLGLIGGVIGGLLGLRIYTWRNQLSFTAWLDIAAVVLPLAQAVARLGNGAKQDLYGPPTTLPWGMLVSENAQRVGPYTELNRYPLDTTHFHPVYAYELILSVLVFFILLRLFLNNSNQIASGDIALLYVILYGAGRFLLEFMRVNVSYVGTINISQVTAGIGAIIALIILLRRIRRRGGFISPHRSTSSENNVLESQPSLS